jgi:hypothetical protein
MQAQDRRCGVDRLGSRCPALAMTVSLVPLNRGQGEVGIARTTGLWRAVAMSARAATGEPLRWQWSGSAAVLVNEPAE